MDGIRLDPTARLIHWQPRGVLSLKMIEDYFAAIASVAWGNEADRFCDLSQLSGADLTYEKMQLVASLRKERLANTRRLKIGIFAPGDSAFAFSRMYQSVVTEDEMDILVSRNFDQVKDFLELATDFTQEDTSS